MSTGEWNPTKTQGWDGRMEDHEAEALEPPLFPASFFRRAACAVRDPLSSHDPSFLKWTAALVRGIPADRASPGSRSGACPPSFADGVGLTRRREDTNRGRLRLLPLEFFLTEKQRYRKQPTGQAYKQIRQARRAVSVAGSPRPLRIYLQTGGLRDIGRSRGESRSLSASGGAG